MSEEGMDPFGGPLRHVVRQIPPWAEQGKTVCGRAADDVAQLVTQEEALAITRKYGPTRARFLFCHICGTRQIPRFDKDPAASVADYAARAQWSKSQERVRHELQAIAALVEAHRDEYDALVAGYGNDELARARQSRRGDGATVRIGRTDV